LAEPVAMSLRLSDCAAFPSEGRKRKKVGTRQRHNLLKPLAQNPCHIAAAVQNADHL
jgi:hypothetical protein